MPSRDFPPAPSRLNPLPKIQQLLHAACRDPDVPVIYSTTALEFKAAFSNATKIDVDATNFESWPWHSPK